MFFILNLLNLILFTCVIGAYSFYRYVWTPKLFGPIIPCASLTGHSYNQFSFFSSKFFFTSILIIIYIVVFFSLRYGWSYIYDRNICSFVHFVQIFICFKDHIYIFSAIFSVWFVKAIFQLYIWWRLILICASFWIAIWNKGLSLILGSFLCA